MSQTVKAANAHTVVSTGWSTPENAYSTTNDTTYATLATAKNATRSGDFGFPAFTTGDIPDHATITSVICRTTWKLTASVTGGVLGMQCRRDSTSTTLGTETTASNPIADTDASQTATGATLTDLRTANEIRARIRATKGNSSTASSGNLDRVYLEVNWTETLTGAAGTISATPSLTAAVKKAGKGAAGALTPTLGFAATGKKVFSVALGLVTLSASLSTVGVKRGLGSGSVSLSASMSATGEVGAEHHSGAASATFPATLTAAGTKSLGAGAGGLSTSASLTPAGRKAIASAVGIASSSASLAEGGVKNSSAGAGAISVSPALSAAASRFSIGAGSLSAAPSASETGSKHSSGTGTLPVTVTMAATGTSSEFHSGSGAIALSAILSLVGVKDAAAALGALPDTPSLIASGFSGRIATPSATFVVTLTATGGPVAEEVVPPGRIATVTAEKRLAEIEAERRRVEKPVEVRIVRVRP